MPMTEEQKKEALLRKKAQSRGMKLSRKRGGGDADWTVFNNGQQALKGTLDEVETYLDGIPTLGRSGGKKKTAAPKNPVKASDFKPALKIVNNLLEQARDEKAGWVKLADHTEAEIQGLKAQKKFYDEQVKEWDNMIKLLESKAKGTQEKGKKKPLTVEDAVNLGNELID